MAGTSNRRLPDREWTLAWGAGHSAGDRLSGSRDDISSGATPARRRPQAASPHTAAPAAVDHFRPHPWHGLAVGPEPPSLLNAYIEITPFDLMKYEVDKISGYLSVDRPQRSSAQHPSLDGFVPPRGENEEERRPRNA